jgi:hypothetical protein
VDIQFHGQISISRLGIQQVGDNPGNPFYRTSFEQFSITFSSGYTRTMDLSSASGQWNYMYIQPPITETGLRFVATKYAYDVFDYHPYGIKEISINGPTGNYG